MTCADTANVTGQHLLFLGTSTISWSIAQFEQAAQFARTHGVDSLLVKFADGTGTWYGGINGYRNIRDAIRAQGVGAIPYMYSYGNKFGALDTEIDLLIQYMQDSGVVCADMEAEWNGQVGWAQHVTSRIQPVSGVFLVSTWGDPDLQNWQGVIGALNPCVNAYMPQQYNNYLASTWTQFGAAGAACLQPTVDMTQEFGANDPVSIARAAFEQGHTALSVWYYETAAANPSLLDAIFAAFPKREENMTLQINQVSQYFTEAVKDQRWHCKQTNIDIAYAILNYYRNCTNIGLQGLSQFGLPLSQETGVPGKPGVTMQLFERGVILYDPKGQVDHAPGLNGPCYPAHVDQGEGLKLIEQHAGVTSSNVNVGDIVSNLHTIQSAAQKSLSDLGQS